MASQLSLKTIRARIATLEAKARQLESAAKPGLTRVLSLIKKHKLTRDDLEIAFAPKSKPSRAKTKRTSKLKGKRIPARYRDHAGNSWSGRGRLPLWLAAAEKAGHDRSKFAVK